MAQAQRVQMDSILDTKSEDVERPKPMPEGSYRAVIVGLPRIDKSAKKQTEFSEYTAKLLEAYDDVDEKSLKEAGGLEDRTMRITFYHTPNSLWRLKEFLDHCGIDSDGTIRERMEETPNCEVGLHVKHEPSQDGESIYANVDKTFPIE